MKLPPLNALRAFEAAARHGGFPGAAEELCVTRGAISHHVRLLEEHLGVALFRRLPQGIELTEQARQLLPVLTDAFERIGEGARRISSDRSDLQIVCPPTMSVRWLIPKLRSFQARHADIRIRLTADFGDWDAIRSGAFDIGICIENYNGPVSDFRIQPLFPMLVVPACAPQLMEGPNGLRQPEDLARVTLLHEHPDRDEWTGWLNANAVCGVDPQSGEVFPNLDMAVKAAVMGHGVVLADLVLTRDEFETGQLVMPFGSRASLTSWGRYCLVTLRARWRDPKVQAFASWVSEEAEKDIETLALRSRFPDWV